MSTEEKYFDLADDVEIEDYASGKIVVDSNKFYFDKPSIVFKDINKVACKCIKLMCIPKKAEGYVQAVLSSVDEQNIETYTMLGYINKKSLKRVFMLDGIDFTNCLVYIDEETGEVLDGELVLAYCI